MDTTINPFRVECDRREANTLMQWTSDRTRLDARIISRNLVEMIDDEN